MGLPNPSSGGLYLPVPGSTITPLAGGPTVDESLGRQREGELSELRHRLEVSKLKAECEEVEQQAAEFKARSRVKRIGLWSGAFICVAGAIHLSAWWVWLFFHPMSDFELVVSTASSAVGVCAGVVVYVASRFGKSKSDSSGLTRRWKRPSLCVLQMSAPSNPDLSSGLMAGAGGSGWPRSGPGF